MIRRFLDRLYLTAGWIAAASILFICVIVSAQVSLNILARIGGPRLSFTIPSYADFAGFALATASFMALSYTLRMGGHIRVNLLIQRLGQGPSWALELLTLLIGALFAGYATYYGGSLMWESWHYGDMSTGIVAVPLWIPQGAMVAGLALLCLAFVDTFFESLMARKPILSDSGSE